MIIVEPCKDCVVISTCQKQWECDKFKEHTYKSIFNDHQCPICQSKDDPVRYDFDPTSSIPDYPIEDNEDNSKSAYPVILNIVCDKCKGMFQFTGIIEIMIEDTEEVINTTITDRKVIYITKESDPQGYEYVYYHGHLDDEYSKGNHHLKGTWDEIITKIKSQFVKTLDW